jgi:hypothetical protein
MDRYARETCAGPVGSARLHSRTMNKVVVVRPACRAVVQGSAGLTTGQRVKRRLQMHLAFLSRTLRGPTGPAHVAVSSDRPEKEFFSNVLSCGTGWAHRRKTNNQPRFPAMV